MTGPTRAAVHRCLTEADILQPIQEIQLAGHLPSLSQDGIK